jgi:hypothetical protein
VSDLIQLDGQPRTDSWDQGLLSLFGAVAPNLGWMLLEEFFKILVPYPYPRKFKSESKSMGPLFLILPR